MQIRRHGWVHRLLGRLDGRARAAEKDLAMLEQAFGHAYEGLLITDYDGNIIKTNPSYAAFLGYTVEEMLGRHCTEVVQNTRMHLVAKTGVPEIAQVQRIRGHEMICSRIPIFEDGKVVAVVGKVMFQDIGELFAMTDKFASLKKELEFYKAELSRRAGTRYSFDAITGQSPALEQVKALARKVARSDTTVLLVGESGTGKEVFAHSIHADSARALGPFVKVNSAAIPENLFESELFGYKAGAFTGASKQGKKGKFALADKGTLFLDEVSELPLGMQVKLLRVLQEAEIEPIGSVRPEAVDVRIVAASNKDLEALMKKGAFREDLYYRLNVVKLDLPPLRDRREDVPLLADVILRQLEKQTGVPVEGLEPDAEALLKAYRWPGNIRELKNVLERALYVKTGTRIGKHDLPRSLVAAVEGSWPVEEPHSLKQRLHHAEEEMIRRALIETRGDKLRAAALLGISKSSLYAKIEGYQIENGNGVQHGR